MWSKNCPWCNKVVTPLQLRRDLEPNGVLLCPFCRNKVEYVEGTHLWLLLILPLFCIVILEQLHLVYLTGWLYTAVPCSLGLLGMALWFKDATLAKRTAT